ncbi:MAG: hypothetical protein KatS3mg057_1394 [Herpetosiphonaceae bacterium]|nr:MAG: hypothetical protein KatS3mg057_1394 [Herpetosiphonaceae bacterium]
MNGSALRILARREVRDALSDWRIALPMAVLTLFLPLLARAAAVFAIRFLNEPGFAEKLIPFMLLLVGFVPSSFSLIPALETFVGERERNTLESLLSAPVDDRQLYLGKFIAGLAPPLLSSLMAMITFALSIKATVNTDISSVLTPLVFIAVVALVAVKAMAMVSAAVVVSSRTTSIRSANLLASFIIIPMSLLVQIEALLLIGNPPRPWTVALIGVGLFVATLAFLGWGMRSFSREAVLAREHRPLLRAGLRSISRRAIGRRPATALSTVIDREVRDTLSDWRILLPILILALILPLVMLAAAIYAVEATGTPNDIARLVPFGMLLVGFLPSSFSLITALESFVGEKERGTLESLLSMPLSDWELYLGKLAAALMTPLLSGLLAMLIFISGLLVAAPPILAVQVQPATIIAMTALLIIISATMVSGAVVISSHTSNIRVANLLASFILLPMSVLIQMIALFVIAERWEVIGIIGLLILCIGAILFNTGMRSFNREEILSREHEQLNLRAIVATFKAFFREYGPVTQPPELRRRSFSLHRAYTEELSHMLRDLRIPLLLVIVGVVVSIAFGIVYDREHETRIMQALVPVQHIGSVPRGSPFLAAAIFLSNFWKIFWAGLLSALTFGAFAYMIPLFAFAAVAHGATWSAAHGKALGAPGFLLAYVLPHGILELPAAILAAAAGLRLGLAAATTPPGISVGRHILWALALYIRLLLLVVGPLLLLAALIEGLITPQVAALVYR